MLMLSPTDSAVLGFALFRTPVTILDTKEMVMGDHPHCLGSVLSVLWQGVGVVSSPFVSFESIMSI